MSEGTVKWFNEKKGYGFIADDEGGEDIFVHFSAIDMPGFKNLNEGDRVSFEIAVEDRGKKAQQVKKI